MKIIQNIIGFFTGKKVTFVLLIACVILVLFCLFLSSLLNASRRTNSTLRNNEATLKNGLNYEQSRNNQLVATNGILVLTNQEIKDYYEKEVMTNLKDLNVRLWRLETFTATNLESVHLIKTTLKDSTRITNLGLEPIKYIDYKSEWLDFYQIQVNNQVETKIVKRDSLIQVVYQPRKEGFVLIRPFKKRPALEQKIKSADPNSIIKYNLYIVPRRKSK